jgi:uncharacterized membrane protein HdeD (DUF308 family)
MRIIMIISSAPLLLAGLFCAANRGQTYAAIAFVAGACLLASGAAEAGAYFIARRRFELPAWMPAEGALALLSAAAVLNDRLSDGEAVPMVFGMWLMAAGTLRVAEAMAAGGAGPAFRLALLLIGIACAALGLYGFFRTAASGPGIAALLGVFLIAQGVGAAALGAGAPRRAPRGIPASLTPAEHLESPDVSDALNVSDPSGASDPS